MKRLEKSRYEEYQQHLLSRGVSEENVTLLPRNITELLPTPIRNDLASFEQEQVKAEVEARQKRTTKTNLRTIIGTLVPLDAKRPCPKERGFVQNSACCGKKTKN